jgi:hypothetical protein
MASAAVRAFLMAALEVRPVQNHQDRKMKEKDHA